MSARGAVAGGGRRIEEVRDAYLLWVDDAELQLRSRFANDVWRALHTDRYWHLRSLAASSPRPFPLIGLEANVQAEWIEGLATQLEVMARAFTLPSECVALVPDTNVLVHYLRFDQLDWHCVVGSKLARLVLPLLVVDELDDLSFRSREVSDRARSVIRALQKHRAGRQPEEVTAVRSGVTLQLFSDPPGHIRDPNSDTELLARVEHLSAFTTRIVIVTGDYGMHLRAQARGLESVGMPDEYRLDARSARG